MRQFYLERLVDGSGVSGTGIVADGVDGKCVLCWRNKISSIVIYDNIEDVRSIHGHNGDTKIVFIN